MPREQSERTCIVTRKVGPAADLMRFALAPDGAVVPDLRARLPGRGAWITPTAAILAEAVRRRAFARAFKAEAAVPPDLIDAVDAAMKRDLLGSLALANKAGAVTAGFFKVEAALRDGSAAVLIHAREAAEDGRRKLRAALRARDGDPISSTPVYDDLSGDELDVALGRDNVIHAALLAGAGSRGCLARWRRLRRFRGADDVTVPPRDVAERSS